jgi:hypothetical protein
MNIGKTTVHRWYNRFNRVLASSKRKKKQKRTRKLKYPTLVDDLKALFSAPSKLKFISLSDIKSRLPDYFPSLSTLAGVSRRRFTNFTKVPVPGEIMVVISSGPRHNTNYENIYPPR